MATFAKAKEPFPRSFLKRANGLPGHDTFSRMHPRSGNTGFVAAITPNEGRVIAEHAVFRPAIGR
jgi:hypothetical protein